MSELMGFDITPNAGTTLRKVLKLEIAPHMEMFEGISAAATKVRDGVQDIGNFRLVQNLFLMKWTYWVQFHNFYAVYC